jgi:hypothetical protein
MGLFDPLNIIGEVLGGSGGNRMRDAAGNTLAGISLPELEKLDPEMYKQVVSLNPELEQAITLGPSEMGGIALDPRYKQTQLAALDKLKNISDANGQDAQFLSQASQLQNDINSNLQGNLGAIQQNLATRGMGGGMSELVSKQLAAQQGANRQAQMGLDLNAQAQQRALMSGNNVAAQMGQTDFGQQADVAKAKDAVANFNAQNQQGVLGRQAGMKFDAQTWNANNAQGTSDKNVGVKNNAEMQNKVNIPQQNFQNQVTKATGVAQHQNNMAAASDAYDDKRRQLIGNIAGAGARAYGAGG